MRIGSHQFGMKADDASDSRPSRITGRLFGMRKALGKFLKSPEVERKIRAGDQSMIAEIESRIDAYDELVRRIEPVAELTDNAGFAQLNAEMQADLDRDLQDLPRQVLEMQAGTSNRAVVNAIEQILWRRYYDIVRNAKKEHDIGIRRRNAELDRLEQITNPSKESR